MIPTFVIISIFLTLISGLIGFKLGQGDEEEKEDLVDPLFDPKGDLDKAKKEIQTLKDVILETKEREKYHKKKAELLDEVIKALDDGAGQEEMMWLLSKTKRALPAIPWSFSSGAVSGFAMGHGNSIISYKEEQELE